MNDIATGMHAIDFNECRVEIFMAMDISFVDRDGDGWNEPMVPDHWEPSGDIHVYNVILYHYDGKWTEIGIKKGSILDYYFRRLLPSDIETQLLKGDCYVDHRN